MTLARGETTLGETTTIPLSLQKAISVKRQLTKLHMWLKGFFHLRLNKKYLVKTDSHSRQSKQWYPSLTNFYLREVFKIKIRIKLKTDKSFRPPLTSCSLLCQQDFSCGRKLLSVFKFRDADFNFKNFAHSLNLPNR